MTVSERPQDTVTERLAALRAQEAELISTVCVKCGHAYRTHFGRGSACYHPVGVKNGQTICRCRGFVDPVSTLGGD